MLRIPRSNVVYETVVQDVKVLVDVSRGENTQNEEFKRVKEEIVCLLKEINSHQMEQKWLQKTPPEKGVAIKARTWSAVYMEKGATVWRC